jgi:hypothetical protein
LVENRGENGSASQSKTIKESKIKSKLGKHLIAAFLTKFYAGQNQIAGTKN